MDRRLALALFLSLAALAVGAAGWQRLQALQPLAAETGPQALARDGTGGLFLATATQLLQIDADGELRGRHEARALGLGRLAALAQGEPGTLWVLDGDSGRIAQCDTRAWRCRPVTPRLGPATAGIAWQFGPERRLLASDSSQGRLQAFAADGAPLPLPGQAWQQPAGFGRGDGQLLLVERGRFRVVALDAVANQPLATVLTTRAAPQAFVQRDTHWWVLEGSPAQLRHYGGGHVTDLPLPLAEPVALLDTGRVLLVASRRDGALFALDPEFDSPVPFASPALRGLLAAQVRQRAGAERELQWLRPALAAGVVLLLLPVPWLLWRRGRERRAATAADTSTKAPARRRPVAAGATPRPPAPDRSGEPGPVRPPAPALLPPPAGATRVMRIAATSGGRHLVCGPDKLVLVEGGKPVLAAPYDDVWLGRRNLLLGPLRLRLHQGLGRARPAWDLDALHAQLRPRLPAGHVLGEFALARRLLARGRPQGLWLLLQALPYPVAVPAILLLLLEFGRLLQGVLQLPLP